MVRKPAAVLIIRLITQKVEKLGVHDGDHKIEGIVRIADNDEHRCSSLPQHIQLQFIVGHQVTQFLDIKWGQPGTAGNQDGFRRLAGSQFIFLILPDSKMLRVVCLQFLKQLIYSIFERFIILTGFRRIDEFQQRGEVLLLLRGLIPNIADERRIQQPLCLDPEILGRFFTLPLGVGNDGVDQFENILLTADIVEGVIVHGFTEVDGIQDFYHIPLIDQHFPALDDDGAFRVRDHIGHVFRHLHQIRLHIEARLAGTGTTDHNHVFVPGVFRILRAAAHGQSFRLGQNDVILKHRVNVWLNVLRPPPAGGTVFLTGTVFFGVFMPEVKDRIKCGCGDHAGSHVHQVDTG